MTNSTVVATTTAAASIYTAAAALVAHTSAAIIATTATHTITTNAAATTTIAIVTATTATTNTATTTTVTTNNATHTTVATKKATKVSAINNQQLKTSTNASTTLIHTQPQSSSVSNEQIFNLLVENTAKLNALEMALLSNVTTIRSEITDAREQCTIGHSLLVAKTNSTDNKVEKLEVELAKASSIIGNIMREKVAADIVLSNVPIFTGESQADLLKLFTNISDAISFKDKNSLMAIFRLNNGARPLPSLPSLSRKTFCPKILVKFNNAYAKQSFMKAYFKHGSLNLASIGFTTATRIYCNDSLLPIDAAIFKEALRLKKVGKIHGTKVKNGKIFVFMCSGDDVPLHVTTVRDLHNLLPN